MPKWTLLTEDQDINLGQENGPGMWVSFVSHTPKEGKRSKNEGQKLSQGRNVASTVDLLTSHPILSGPDDKEIERGTRTRHVASHKPETIPYPLLLPTSDIKALKV